MLYPLLPLGPSLLPSPTQSRQRSPCRRPCRDLQMDPDPLRLLETAHPLRSPTLRPSPPNSRFRLRPSYRLTRPKTVNKRVNKIEKFVDGPTQMSRRRRIDLWMQAFHRVRRKASHGGHGGNGGGLQVLGFPRFPIILVVVVV